MEKGEVFFWGGLFCKLCMRVVNVWCFGVYGWTFVLVCVRHTCMYQQSCLMFLAIWCMSLYLYWKVYSLLCSFSLSLSSAVIRLLDPLFNAAMDQMSDITHVGAKISES